MNVVLFTLILLAAAVSGCAGGCVPLDGEGDNARVQLEGVHDPWDDGLPGDDASGRDHRADATDSPDAAADTAAPAVVPDASAPDVGSPDLGSPDLQPTGPICGDGVVESPETCDDSRTADCRSTQDGGDGACVAAGTCSDGYVFDGAGCVPEQITQHVHIFVANDCSMVVDPPSMTVPRGQTVRFEWHNHSQFYAVDVWQSYIGGFTDLGPGQTWGEQFEWCFNVNPYDGYSDITTNEVCPSHRFMIHCNGR